MHEHGNLGRARNRYQAICSRRCWAVVRGRLSMPFFCDPTTISISKPTHHQPRRNLSLPIALEETRSFVRFCRAYSECGFAASRRLFRICQGHWTTAGGLTRRRPQGCQLSFCTVPPPLCPRLSPQDPPSAPSAALRGVYPLRSVREILSTPGRHLQCGTPI
jgi:hypothetical protein